MIKNILGNILDNYLFHFYYISREKFSNKDIERSQQNIFTIENNLTPQRRPETRNTNSDRLNYNWRESKQPPPVKNTFVEETNTSRGK